MLKKSTKEILIKDLIEIKALLVREFDNSQVPFAKGGALDQFYLTKALEFQRNAILYDSLLNIGGIDEGADPDKTSPLEKIALEITDIRSAIESHN